jgi:hypothetical protein
MRSPECTTRDAPGGIGEHDAVAFRHPSPTPSAADAIVLGPDAPRMTTARNGSGGARSTGVAGARER